MSNNLLQDLVHFNRKKNLMMQEQIYMDRLSTLSPIQESLSENSLGTVSSSVVTQSPILNVSAFSSLNDLKAKQKQLRHKNKKVRLKMGGSIPSECIMTAIPESHFATANRSSGPTEADLKLLGLSDDYHNEKTTKEFYQIVGLNSRREYRDESPRDGISFDRRSDAEFSSDTPDGDSLGEQVMFLTKKSDEVSGIRSMLRSVSERSGKRPKTRKAISKRLKKPFGKFAKQIWKKVKPLISKPKALFKRKKDPQLTRSKGILT